jgi:hypothetical protein
MRRLIGVIAVAVCAGCSSSSSSTSTTGSGSTGATTAGTAATSSTTSSGSSTSTSTSTSTTSGTTGVSGSTTSSTGSSGLTTAGSTSSGGSGGAFNLSGSAAFSLSSSYYTFGTFRDGGLDKHVTGVIGVSLPTTCAQLQRQLQRDAGRVTTDQRIAEVAVVGAGDVQAGTYAVQELFSVLFGAPVDGGVGLAIIVHDFVDGGAGLEYDGTDGSLTVSQPDGVSNVAGNFSSRMIVDGGGVAADLTGSFDVPYCQTP